MLNLSKLKKVNLNKDPLINKGELSNEMRHYPASTKEWFDSVYNYDYNRQKDIPSLDTGTYKIIRNYFNMFSSRLERSVMFYRIARWKRRLKLNRILISKPEFKHTNDKVIITLYVYNRELSLYTYKMNKVKKKLLAEYFWHILTNKRITFNKIKIIKDISNKFFHLKKTYKKILKNLKLIKKQRSYDKYLKNFFDSFNNYKNQSKFYKKRRLLRVGTTLNKSERKLDKPFKREGRVLRSIHYILKSKISMRLVNLLNTKKYNKDLLKKFNNEVLLSKFKFNKINILYNIRKISSRIRLYIRFNRIIKFNLYKFNVFIIPLKNFLERIYKKNVEFNIVTLKSYHLNSSIMTKVIATKLRNRNRKNRLLRIVKIVLSKIKLPLTRRLEYLKERPRKKILQNIIIRHYLNKSYFQKKPYININSLNKRIRDKNSNIILNKLWYSSLNNDKLDLILKSLYVSKKTLKVNSEKSDNLLLNRNLENVVLDSLENKSISGIRIEASGRLTKRITAARSLFKIKQIGTIRNINSSYKRIPTTLLRGNLRSNSEFSKISSKTRIGAFGLKGWVSNI